MQSLPTMLMIISIIPLLSCHIPTDLIWHWQPVITQPSETLEEFPGRLRNMVHCLFQFSSSTPWSPLSSFESIPARRWQCNVHPAVRCSGRERMINGRSGWSEKNRNVFDLDAQWPYLSTDLTRYAAHSRSEYSAYCCMEHSVRCIYLLFYRSDLRSE